MNKDNVNTEINKLLFLSDCKAVARKCALSKSHNVRCRRYDYWKTVLTGGFPRLQSIIHENCPNANIATARRTFSVVDPDVDQLRDAYKMLCSGRFNKINLKVPCTLRIRTVGRMNLDQDELIHVIVCTPTYWIKYTWRTLDHDYDTVLYIPPTTQRRHRDMSTFDLNIVAQFIKKGPTQFGEVILLRESHQKLVSSLSKWALNLNGP